MSMKILCGASAIVSAAALALTPGASAQPQYGQQQGQPGQSQPPGQQGQQRQPGQQGWGASSAGLPAPAQPPQTCACVCQGPAPGQGQGAPAGSWQGQGTITPNVQPGQTDRQPPGSDPPGDPPQATGSQPGGPQGAGQRRAQLSSADQQFLREAYSINTGEAELGKLAELKGTTDEVRNFGRHMQDDHSLMTTELREFAQKGNFDLPNQLQPAQKQLYDTLSGLSGQAFDKAYLDHMVSGHQKAIGIFENEVKNGQNSVVKQFAEKELPMLRSHEDFARFDQEHPNL